MNANPYTTGISAMPPFLMRPEFHPDGVYRINVDNNGDAHADVAFTFAFSEFRDGTQTTTAYYAVGDQARRPEPAGDVLISGTPVGFDAAAQPVQAGPGRLPADDVANYLGPRSRLLQDQGGYAPEEARAAALIVLPDILRYDRDRPAAYPNGRALDDDAFSARFAWLSNGNIPPQGLKPHDDVTAEFPYLGPPNRYPAG